MVRAFCYKFPRTVYYIVTSGYALTQAYNFVWAATVRTNKENEHKMGRHIAAVINELAKSMNPTMFNPASARTEPWTVVPYQSTHNTGGTIMGTSPKTSAVNKYLQSWDCHNLFVVGANVFPHNSVYNPTGPVGALAYWTADAIRNRYAKNPGPLVSA